MHLDYMTVVRSSSPRFDDTHPYRAHSLSDLYQPESTRDSRFFPGPILLHGSLRWDHVLSRKYHPLSKSGVMAPETASPPKTKTIHCSFMNSAPNRDHCRSKVWRSPFQLFWLVCTVNTSQAFLHHPGPLQPKLTTIYLTNKFQTPNSRI